MNMFFIMYLAFSFFLGKVKIYISFIKLMQFLWGSVKSHVVYNMPQWAK